MRWWNKTDILWISSCIFNIFFYWSHRVKAPPTTPTRWHLLMTCPEKEVTLPPFIDFIIAKGTCTDNHNTMSGILWGKKHLSLISFKLYSWTLSDLNVLYILSMYLCSNPYLTYSCPQAVQLFKYAHNAALNQHISSFKCAVEFIVGRLLYLFPSCRANKWATWIIRVNEWKRFTSCASSWQQMSRSVFSSSLLWFGVCVVVI